MTVGGEMLPRLEERYERIEREKTTLYIEKRYHDTIVPLIDNLFEGDFSEHGGEYREGRARHPILRFPDADLPPILLRRYRHGGLLRGVTGPFLLGARRATDEVSALLFAEHRGVAVPHPVGVGWQRAFGPWVRCVILSEYLERALDLPAWISRREAQKAEWPCASLATEVGRAVRLLHGAGIYHGDLNLMNVLVEEGRVVIVDLDRSRFGGNLDETARFRNVGRFYRSGEKLRHFGMAIAEDALSAFLAGYCRDDEERRRLEDHLHRVRSRLWPHRLRWRLIRRPPRTSF